MTDIDLSIVMPCLNESDTLESCIRKARTALDAAAIRGEIIVADNGSTDGSREIAQRLGARVVPVTTRGYGAALMGGIDAACGRFVIMGDADDSYDFGEVPKFVERLQAGFDLVLGCRLESGGGRVMPGAMPLLHRWLGNPMFSLIARHWFDVPVRDIYCGLRGFTKELYRATRPAMHRDGIRDRDDYQGEPQPRTDRRGTDYASPAMAGRVTRHI